MSFLVDKLAKKAGDMVADKIKNALGGDDDDDKKRKDKDDKDGGFLSIFKRDKDDDDDDDRRDDHDDDGDKGKIHKKSGFSGLFSEQDQQGEAGAEDTTPEYNPPGNEPGPCDHMKEEDLDMMSDLMEVANEMN
ncbi:hypothetical protein WMY93_018335 [Mugilogobius chulae]|uniref:Uncharacterized protein n=1 Tax=Mugilogobius chulae TaxID=88201 RepID=A0AAW0NIV8_9GOBI